jgi:hypothetical protein
LGHVGGEVFEVDLVGGGEGVGDGVGLFFIDAVVADFGVWGAEGGGETETSE